MSYAHNIVTYIKAQFQDYATSYRVASEALNRGIKASIDNRVKQDDCMDMLKNEFWNKNTKTADTEKDFSAIKMRVSRAYASAPAELRTERTRGNSKGAAGTHTKNVPSTVVVTPPSTDFDLETFEALGLKMAATDPAWAMQFAQKLLAAAMTR